MGNPDHAPLAVAGIPGRVALVPEAEGGMTDAQKLEMLRLTSSMWVLIRCAKEKHPYPASVHGPGINTARILEQRGFMTLIFDGKDHVRKKYSVRLTDAGLEATALLGLSRRAVAARVAAWDERLPHAPR
jgi:hypothetical protein